MAPKHPSGSRGPATSSSEGVTLWRRIADDFEQAIVTGEYASGDRLPAETDIAAQFRVNRHTVRRALAELAERGIVKASRGSGTFVEGPKLAYPIGRRTRFSEIVGQAGLEVGGRLVAHETEPAKDSVARLLKIAVGDLVVRLDILRTAGRVPICAATSWLPAQTMADAAKVYRATRSITKTLAHFGISDYQRQETRITAALADSIDAKRLDIGWLQPVLVVESVDVTPAGQPVVTSRARFAADRLVLVVKN
jgi:GntR family transcriptional regulator, phosphonate transport system regulatory protein